MESDLRQILVKAISWISCQHLSSNTRPNQENRICVRQWGPARNKPCITTSMVYDRLQGGTARLPVAPRMLPDLVWVIASDRHSHRYTHPLRQGFLAQFIQLDQRDTDTPL